MMMLCRSRHPFIVFVVLGSEQPRWGLAYTVPPNSSIRARKGFPELPVRSALWPDTPVSFQILPRILTLASVDSAAFFNQRVQELGLGEFLSQLHAKGYTTTGRFAFSSPYAPTAADDSAFVTNVVNPILGTSDHVLRPQLRRLGFETYAAMAADVQRQHARKERGPPLPLPTRKMSQAARAEKYEAQVRRRPSLRLVGQLQPSNVLADKAADMAESGVLKYVPWAACTTRGQEVTGDQEVRELPDVKADLQSDLKLHNALRRRGLAFDQVWLMSYDQHELFMEHIFSELQRDPHLATAPSHWLKPRLSTRKCSGG